MREFLPDRRDQSAMGQSRRFDRVQLTSGLTPQADIIADRRHVSKVPTGDIPLSRYRRFDLG